LGWIPSWSEPNEHCRFGARQTVSRALKGNLDIWIAPLGGQMAQILARAKGCTPSAWMMLVTVPNCVLNPVPNLVRSVGHFIRAQMGNFS
jgi:hypothetical protein